MRNIMDLARRHGSTAFALLFGLCVLAFLVTTSHKNWFEVKPASGSAAAMSLASVKTGTTR